MFMIFVASCMMLMSTKRKIMCVYYIPWICCGGYNFLLMCVINWIKCMGGSITCWHTNFTRRKQKQKNQQKKEEDFRKQFSLWENHQYLQIRCKLKWAKLEIHEKWFKKKLNHKTFLFFFVVVKHAQNVMSLISNCTLLKYLMFWFKQLHLNHKSYVCQPTIIMYHTKVLKILFVLSNG